MSLKVRIKVNVAQGHRRSLLAKECLARYQRDQRGGRAYAMMTTTTTTTTTTLTRIREDRQSPPITRRNLVNLPSRTGSHHRSVELSQRDLEQRMNSLLSDRQAARIPLEYPSRIRDIL